MFSKRIGGGVLVWLCLTAGVVAQSSSDDSGTALVTEKRLEEFRQQVQNADLPQAERDAANSLLTQTQQELKKSQAAQTQAKSNREALLALETEQARLKQQIADHSAPRVSDLAAAQSLAAAEGRVTRLLSDQATNREQQQRLNAVSVADRIAQLEKSRDQLTTEQAAHEKEVATESTFTGVLREAQSLFHTARGQRILDELQAVKIAVNLQEQSQSLDLPRLRLEVLAQQDADIQQEIDFRRKEAQSLRDKEAAERLESAQADSQQRTYQSAEYGISFDEILKRNQEIAQIAAQVTQDSKRIEQEVTSRKRELDDFGIHFDNLKMMVRDIGLTEPIGLRLRKQRSQLPTRATIQRRLSDRMPTIETAYLAYYEYKELLDTFAAEPKISALLENQPLDNAEEEIVREEAAEVLSHQKEFLTDLVALYDRYTNQLDELDRYDRKLLKQTQDVRKFIDERVLWIRSHKPIGPQALGTIPVELQGLLTGSAVPQTFLEDVATDGKRVPWLYALVTLIVVILLSMGKRLRQRLGEIGRSAGRRGYHHLTPTIRAVFLTGLVAAWPLLVWFPAWRLGSYSRAAESSALLSLQFQQLAILIFSAEFFRQACRPDGLCEAHFDWRATVCQQINRALRAFFGISVPLMILHGLLNATDAGQGLAVLERLAFVAACLSLTYVLHDLLQPDRGLVQVLFPGDGWAKRLRSSSHQLVRIIPIVCAILSIIGFYYTASELARKLVATVWLAGLLVLLRELLLRWLVISRRRLKLAQMKERRDAEAHADTPDEGGAIELDAEQADVNILGEQTQRLVNTSTFVAALAGVWMIWIDVLPALEFLDRWPVWTVSFTEVIAGTANGADAQTVERFEPVTLVDLGKFLLILILTVTAGRNIPGVLEIAILQKLPLENSIRYAITSLTRYGIFFVGLLLASQAIGLSWAKVQWLVAALTFGLGFGLQEIFANFISGLILLVEQPIRVGDVVTIDGVSGVVSRIRIRATTITDWDRREYIVPNREFITGRLLNWTLTDRTNRVVVNVGVAYGTDTERVAGLLREIANSHGEIMKDPKPLVTFEEFGDSTLNFILRAYLPSLENRLSTVHELHSEIHRRFNREGIEIAFPQQDINVRNLPGASAKDE